MSALKDAAEALKTIAADGYVWLNFNTPTAEELMAISGPLGLHHLAIEDCVSEGQIPKMDDFPENTFIVFNRFKYASRELKIEEVDFFLGKKYLLTSHRSGLGNGDTFEKLMECLKRSGTHIGKGPEYLMHLFIDFIVDCKFDTLEKIQDEIDGLEEKAMARSGEFNPQELMDIRGILLEIHKSLFHEREILTKVCRRDSPFVSEQSIYYFRDVYDHLAKFFEFIEMSRETLTSLMELYLSLMNIRMTEVSNQTNQVMKRLTLITTIFMPLTLLAGIGGMSEWSMMTGSGNWKFSYPFFFLMMAMIGTLNYYLLKWKKWV